MDTETLLFLNSFKARRKGQSWNNAKIALYLTSLRKRQYKLSYKKGHKRILFTGWTYPINLKL